MSIAAVAAKAGGTGVLLVGVPGTLYAFKDNFFLYSVEKQIIDGEVKVSVTGPTEQPSNVEVAVVSSSSKPSWKCVIKAKNVKDIANPKDLTESDDKKRLATYIKNNILTSDNTSTASEKHKSNLKTLVWGCVNKRTKEEETAIEAEWVVPVEKENDHLLVSFFGTKEKASATS